MSTKTIFGGVVVCLLLSIYVYLVWVGVSVVGCTPHPACQETFNKGMAAALATIGGLVSAIVIAELAITKPGEPPLARTLSSDASAATSNALKVVSFTYLGLWVLVGVTVFVVGLRRPDAPQPLIDLGQAWLGLAVAAAYSYFGIEPRS